MADTVVPEMTIDIPLADVRTRLRQPGSDRYGRRRIAVQASITLITATIVGIVVYNVTSSAAPASRNDATVIADLNSSNPATRTSALLTLQQSMRTTPARQPADLQAITAFIREQSPVSQNGSDVTAAPSIQDAVALLRERNPAHDGGLPIDLSNANLAGTDLTGINLVNANLANIDLADANLANARLNGAVLSYAYLGEATITGADLSAAQLNGASFADTPWCRGTKPVFPALQYNCAS
jgi:Pentapeptide repeats (8 copies)